MDKIQLVCKTFDLQSNNISRILKINKRINVKSILQCTSQVTGVVETHSNVLLTLPTAKFEFSSDR